MSWFSGFHDSGGVTVAVTEVRFTQGTARLNSVGIAMSSRSQQFVSRTVQPWPADPVSHRSKVQWPDTELKLEGTAALSDQIKITLTNRRRRFRTVIGTTVFTLASLDPPATGRDAFTRTLLFETALSPSLNLKVDLLVQLHRVDSWSKIRPYLQFPHARSSPDFPRGSVVSIPGGPGTRAGSEPSNASLNPSVSSLDPSVSSLDPSLDPSVSSLEPSTSSSSSTATALPLRSFSSRSSHRTGFEGANAQDAMEALTNSAESLSTSFSASLSAPSLDSGFFPGPEQESSVSLGSFGNTGHHRDLGFKLGSGAAGVVFIEIVSVANLPKFRTLTGISFDMDPFVVMSFGRKVYKTPYRRHTLNPTFNCKIAFEVLPNEKQFSVVFAVWDMDRITLNDRVAETEIPVATIMERYAPACDPQTQLYDLDNHVPSVLVLPLEHKAGTAEMLLKAHYYPEAAIRQQMWRGVIGLYMDPPDDRKQAGRYASLKGALAGKMKSIVKGTPKEKPDEDGECPSPLEGLDFEQLRALLNSLGSTLSDDSVRAYFFTKHGRDPELDMLEEDLIVLELEHIVRRGTGKERIILFRICPICHQASEKLQGHRALHHLAVCASRQWAESNSVLLDSNYVSSAQASKRWYSKFLSKFSYGSYKLGAHSANILVQDRVSGQISEEKIATSVRIGIRMIYALGPVERKRFQSLLKKYTVRQGIKYSSRSSASHIEPFIRYHNLDMSEVQLPVSAFPTFNEFFYRKLKPGVRPCENHKEQRTAVSAADCRLSIFPSVSHATQLWIKGKNFSVQRLLGSTYPDDVQRYSEMGSSVAVFRLAPQDYHRVHSPVDGIMGQPRHIDGHYYTVNPMAVRSTLDVFGENARTVFPIQSPVFGKVMVVMIGAMMVGSCIVTAKPGKPIHRTDELGYFRFGGSTVVVLFERNKLVPDSDLMANSRLKIETLVKVGMSIGHAPGVPEFVRSYDTRHATISRAKSAISGGGAYLPFALD